MWRLFHLADVRAVLIHADGNGVPPGVAAILMVGSSLLCDGRRRPLAAEMVRIAAKAGDHCTVVTSSWVTGCDGGQYRDLLNLKPLCLGSRRWFDCCLSFCWPTFCVCAPSSSPTQKAWAGLSVVQHDCKNCVPSRDGPNLQTVARDDFEAGFAGKPASQHFGSEQATGRSFDVTI